ncbi:MAG: FAD-dependent oxidoreductase, partial [Desulfobacteraceae bacterium]|nr:FAD-dependent oxidoreductase [Desulfobacteraceae bacterium]
MKLSDLPEHWDLIVIGGGITGAAVLLEAARRGVRTLLLEGRDFAWGTSSRSSKLVHGGLRYLRQGRLALTRTAVRARETLLARVPGLVDPLPFFVPLYRGRPPGRTALRIGLNIYDLIAGRRTHRYLSRAAFIDTFPGLGTDALLGAYRFEDAQTDDARLVLRLIQAA